MHLVYICVDWACMWPKTRLQKILAGRTKRLLLWVAKNLLGVNELAETKAQHRNHSFLHVDGNKRWSHVDAWIFWNVMYEVSNTQHTCQENVVDYCPSWQYSSSNNTELWGCNNSSKFLPGSVWCNVPTFPFFVFVMENNGGLECMRISKEAKKVDNDHSIIQLCLLLILSTWSKTILHKILARRRTLRLSNIASI